MGLAALLALALSGGVAHSQSAPDAGPYGDPCVQDYGYFEVPALAPKYLAACRSHRDDIEEQAQRLRAERLCFPPILSLRRSIQEARERLRDCEAQVDRAGSGTPTVDAMELAPVEGVDAPSEAKPKPKSRSRRQAMPPAQPQAPERAAPAKAPATPLEAFRSEMKSAGAWGVLISDAAENGHSLLVQVTMGYVAQKKSVRLEFARALVNVWARENGGEVRPVMIISPMGEHVGGTGLTGVYVDDD